MTTWEKLAEPFPAAAIHWRVGSTTRDKTKGMALAYIDARDVMARLDEVCGPGKWQSKFTTVNGAVCCSIGILANVADGLAIWVWKSDGAGQTAYEGDKGQFSDAFKRAAVQHGVGRYLYAVDAQWVAIEPQGKSFKIIPIALARLTQSLTTRRVVKDVDPKAFEKLFIETLGKTSTYAEALEVADGFKPEFSLLEKTDPKMVSELRMAFLDHIELFEDRPQA